MSGPLAPHPNEISCEQCRELLSDYVDRELSQDELAAVERHVATCLKCSTESSRMAGLKKVVQHWDGVKGSAEFRKSVLEKMTRESQLTSSAPFTQAAGAAKEAADGSTRGLPVGWMIMGATVLAIAAFFLTRYMRGG